MCVISSPLLTRFFIQSENVLFSFPDGYRSKKRRTSETVEIEDRLESLILRVGEKSTASLESNLEGLASVLEADLSTYKGKILNILSECAKNVPDKCTIYTTLIGLLNTKNYNFGGEVSKRDVTKAI